MIVLAIFEPIQDYKLFKILRETAEKIFNKKEYKFDFEHIGLFEIAMLDNINLIKTENRIDSKDDRHIELWVRINEDYKTDNK